MNPKKNNELKKNNYEESGIKNKSQNNIQPISHLSIENTVNNKESALAKTFNRKKKGS